MPDTHNPAADYERQATACLAAAAAHRIRLLAVAERLAGTPEEGMDLFQEAVLRCHDQIQVRGFNGDHFEFYLLKTIQNLAHPSKQKLAPRHVELTPSMVHGMDSFEENSQGAPWVGGVRKTPCGLAATDAPATDATAHLAAQVSAEAHAHFEMSDRVALRLHAEGYSYQQISEMTTGGDQSWIRRRVNKMKLHLRAVFGQSWANLHAE